MKKITKTCKACNKTFTIEVTDEQYDQLQLPRNLRPPIQKILPNQHPGIRELFITGLCDKCFDRAFFKGEVYGE